MSGIKLFCFSLLLAVLIQPLAGCTLSKEDEDFYYRGWLWPRSRDDDYDRARSGGINYE